MLELRGRLGVLAELDVERGPTVLGEIHIVGLSGRNGRTLALLHGLHALTVAEVWNLAPTHHACTMRLLHASCLHGVVRLRDSLLVRNGLLRLETQWVLAD